MNASDKQAFAALITDALAFYRQALTPFAIGVWWQACERFDIEQVSKALSAHAMDPERGHFPPMPADLVRVLAGTQTDRALVAWGVVHRSMQAEGAYRSAVFAEPAIHAAIDDMGGWQRLCRSSIEELPFTQKRFCDTYRAYVARGCREWSPVLLGEHDATNAATGHGARTNPALIGDKARCELVMKGPDERALALLADPGFAAIASGLPA